MTTFKKFILSLLLVVGCSVVVNAQVHSKIKPIADSLKSLILNPKDLDSVQMEHQTNRILELETKVLKKMKSFDEYTQLYIKALQCLRLAYYSDTYDSAIFLGKSILANRYELESDSIYAQIAQIIGDSYLKTSRDDSALKYYYLAFDDMKKEKDFSGMSYIFPRIFDIHDLKGEQFQSRVFLLNQIEYLRENSDDPYFINVCKIKLSSVYAEERDYDNALKYGMEAMHYFEQSAKNTQRKTLAYLLIGKLLLKTGNPSEAINKFDVASQIAEKVNYQHAQVLAKMGRIECLIEMKQWNLAKPLLLEVRSQANSLKESKLVTEHDKWNTLFKIEILDATMKYELGDYQASLGVLHDALINVKDITRIDLERLIRFYELMYQTNDKLKNFQKALVYHHRFKRLNDSLYTIQRNEDIARVHAELDLKEIEVEKERFKNSLIIAEKEGARQKYQKRWYIAGLMTTILLLGASLFSIVAYRKRKKLEAELANTTISSLKQSIAEKSLQLQEVKSEMQKSKVKLPELIEKIQMEKNWVSFEPQFKATFPKFYSNLTNYKIGEVDQRYCVLLKLGFSNKEIAQILSVNADTVKKARNRLRKKFSLTPEVELNGFIAKDL